MTDDYLPLHNFTKFSDTNKMKYSVTNTGSFLTEHKKDSDQL